MRRLQVVEHRTSRPIGVEVVEELPDHRWVRLRRGDGSFLEVGCRGDDLTVRTTDGQLVVTPVFANEVTVGVKP